MSDTDRRRESDVLEDTRQKTKEPPLYRVILHNDDYTTMEFVVQVLETVFLKSPAEAFRIMMQVHIEGQGLCGLYPPTSPRPRSSRRTRAGARARLSAPREHGRGVTRQCFPPPSRLLLSVA